MSHEIRTPMNAILGLAHLSALVQDLDHARDYLQKIQSSAQSPLQILNDVLDVLDMLKIEAGKLNVEQRAFDLAEVLDQVAGLMRITAEDF